MEQTIKPEYMHHRACFMLQISLAVYWLLYVKLSWDNNALSVLLCVQSALFAVAEVLCIIFTIMNSLKRISIGESSIDFVWKWGRHFSADFYNIALLGDTIFIGNKYLLELGDMKNIKEIESLLYGKVKFGSGRSWLVRLKRFEQYSMVVIAIILIIISFSGSIGKYRGLSYHIPFSLMQVLIWPLLFLFITYTATLIVTFVLGQLAKQKADKYTRFL